MPKRAAHPGKTGGSKLTVTLLSICFAAIVWAAHLTLVYGTVTVTCAHGFTGDVVAGLNIPAFAVVVLTIVALAAIGAGSYLLNAEANGRNADAREERQFENRVTQWLSMLAAFGVFWAGAAAFFVSPCLELR
ncbi:MAG TPA: hypothetical protein VFY21_09260 [Xanthobacteraceae bacterium]|nr:hypothetical protein [Xanthobacteraceae bacterium]